MSYSRWGDSSWYTFWGSSDNKFTICGIPKSYEFSYYELKEDMECCIQLIKSKEPDTYTDAEFDELKIYIKEYIEEYYDTVEILYHLPIRDLLDKYIENYNEVWRTKELKRRLLEDTIPDKYKLKVLTMLGDGNNGQ